MDEPILLHVAPAQAWHAALASGQYQTPDLPTTGFIHLCRPSQLPFVLEKFFPTRTGFLLLRIDAARLRSRLVYEFSEPGQPSFPHLYGPLNADAVISADPLPG